MTTYGFTPQALQAFATRIKSFRRDRATIDGPVPLRKLSCQLRDQPLAEGAEIENPEKCFHASYTCRFVVVGYANRSHDKTNREAFLLLATENVSAQLSFRSRTAHPGFWMND
jgi:hypothetical protein